MALRKDILYRLKAIAASPKRSGRNYSIHFTAGPLAASHRRLPVLPRL
jgi:hypothetical protein